MSCILQSHAKENIVGTFLAWEMEWKWSIIGESYKSKKIKKITLMEISFGVAATPFGKKE